MEFVSLRLGVRILFGIPFLLLFALLIRGGVLLTPGALKTDPDSYRRLAENIVEHGTFGMQQAAQGGQSHFRGENDNSQNNILRAAKIGTVPTAYRPPLYPLALVPCAASGSWETPAIAALHVLLGVATVALVLLLGRWWGLGRGGAALAAVLVACDPILLAESAQVMTETFAAFLATLGLVVLTWSDRRPSVCRMLTLGVVLALGSLCRPTMLLFAAAVGAVLLWRGCRRRLPSPMACRRRLPSPMACRRRLPSPMACRRRLPSPMETPDESATGVASYKVGGARENSRRLTAAGASPKCFLPLLAFSFGAFLALCPWMIRNQIQFGRPIVATTHGGYTLLLANNPSFYEWLRSGEWGSVWSADDAEFSRQCGRFSRNELESNEQAYAEARKTIATEPGTFFYACLVRLGRFWSPLPHQLSADETPLRRAARWMVALWYVLEFTLAAIGVWLVIRAKPQAAGWLWGLLLVVCTMAPHVVYWTDMRMRAPVMPVVALAAAAGAIYCHKRGRGAFCLPPASGV